MLVLRSWLEEIRCFHLVANSQVFPPTQVAFTLSPKAMEKGMTEDEMVGWHHQLSGPEFEQTPGDGEGQGSLVCYSPWVQKELDTTEQLN